MARNSMEGQGRVIAYFYLARIHSSSGILWEGGPRARVAAQFSRNDISTMNACKRVQRRPVIRAWDKIPRPLVARLC